MNAVVMFEHCWYHQRQLLCSNVCEKCGGHVVFSCIGQYECDRCGPTQAVIGYEHDGTTCPYEALHAR